MIQTKNDYLWGGYLLLIYLCIIYLGFGLSHGLSLILGRPREDHGLGGHYHDYQTPPSSREKLSAWK